MSATEAIMHLVDSYKNAQAQRQYGCLPRIRAKIEQAVKELESKSLESLESVQ